MVAIDICYLECTSLSRQDIVDGAHARRVYRKIENLKEFLDCMSTA